MSRAWPLLPVLIALAILGCNGGSEDAPTRPPPQPFDPALAAEITTIREGASTLRGLPIATGITEGWLARAAWSEWLDDSIAGQLTEDDRAELQAFNRAFRLLRMMGPDDDFLDEYTGDLSTSVLGLYFYDEDALILLDEPASLSLTDRMVLAHEYVHSFQDIAFDPAAQDHLIDDEDGSLDATEYAVTLSCIREGDATLAGLQYAEQVGGPDWRDTIGAESDDEADEFATIDDDEFPPALERYSSFDYRECYFFVRAVYEDGGWDAVNDLHSHPPSTTEQVLHLEKYRNAEGPIPLEQLDLASALGGSWQRLEIGTFGEFDVYNHLFTIGSDPERIGLALENLESLASDPEIDPASALILRSFTADDISAEAQGNALAAAAGWGAGWLAVYWTADVDQDSELPRTLIHLSIQWDTVDDLNEYLFVMGTLLPFLGGDDFYVDEEQAHWQDDREAGFLTWNLEDARSELLISTHLSVTKVAAAALARVADVPAYHE